MALLHIPVDRIDEAQLQRLLDARTAEARDIDYKRDTYGGSDADHAELLADVSSFANTVGGDLIIGIGAWKGVPAAFAPLTGDADSEVLRLEQIVRSGLQPRVALQPRVVSLKQGGHVIVLRIPRSYNPPHRIIRQGKGQGRFWARSSAGKYEPNVNELRSLFTLAPQLAERMRAFRADRVAKIAAGDTPVALQDQRVLVLHIVPFSAFDLGSSLPLEAVAGSSHAFPPLGSRHAQHQRVNFDGVLMLSNADEAASAQRAYAQIFRSGALEAVASVLRGGDKPRLNASEVDATIVKYGTIYLKSLQALGIEPPYAVMASLIGVKGAPASYGLRETWHDEDAPVLLDRDQFHFKEVVLQAVPTSNQDFGALIRPMLEQVANIAGRARSPSFDPRGAYLLNPA